MSRSQKARRKERRRALKLTEGVAEQTPRRTSATLLGSIAVVAAVTIAGALITHTGNAANSPSGHRPTKTEMEVSTLLKGIPQHGDALGQPTAPITLQIFGDLECEDVRTFMMWLLPDIIRDWVRTDIVQIQYRSFMTDTLFKPKVFVTQQVAALAAGAQHRMWNFIDAFYHDQGKEYTPYVTESYLEDIASQAPGLTISQWNRDRENIQLADRVIKDDQAARALGFHDTPSFLIGRTGGKLTKLLGDQLNEVPGPGGYTYHLKHPVSFISTEILKEAIEQLS